MNGDASNSPTRVYDRALLLHGSKRNEVLSLAEVEQYGLDSFADDALSSPPAHSIYLQSRR